MPRVISFIVLLAIIILIGTLFFQVMVQFIVPLFLAAVMVVVFKPLHVWTSQKCGNRPRLTAALTTLAIVLIVLLPISGLFVRAIGEGASLYTDFIEKNPTSAVPPGETDAIHTFVGRLVESLNPTLEKFHLPILGSDQVYQFADERLQTIAAPLALGGVKILAGILVGLAIMVLSMYYFFSDGPAMLAALMKLSPLDDQYEQELLDKFGDISRAVVVATLLSAIVQGILAGAGFWFAGLEPVFFLTALTAFLSMVPFVGAAAVWVPVCLWLYLYNGHPDFPDGRPIAAIVLAIYCLGIVSMVDNLIKPLVLHGQSKLHPLLAMLSVIGGVQALGPIGILVGPMLVAFLQALLNMLSKELHLLGEEADQHGTPEVLATKKEDKQSNDSSTPLPTVKSSGEKQEKNKKK